MSNYTPTVNETFEFDGDTVVVKYNRLKQKHLLLLAPHMNDENKTLSFEDQVKFSEVAGAILPDVIVSMTGLTDNEGNDVPLDKVVEETYFTKLVSDIVSSLMKNSFYRDDDEKK